MEPSGAVGSVACNCSRSRARSVSFERRDVAWSRSLPAEEGLPIVQEIPESRPNVDRAALYVSEPRGTEQSLQSCWIAQREAPSFIKRFGAVVE